MSVRVARRLTRNAILVPSYAGADLSARDNMKSLAQGYLISSL